MFFNENRYHVWAKRDDPILPALVYPILPGIGMV
ncbi:hypothetical protein NP493_294g03028 [Ridgeia piscesae]|uniref:Uncharacterized protein n=1 Tax=Ridgeia piscesae TaxID=27915 RepID=A0AAD9UC48_RIDPI|nr:hypothetical protein NP493_294g03028 [Ridgeia piscesae]